MSWVEDLLLEQDVRAARPNLRVDERMRELEATIESSKRPAVDELRWAIAELPD